jgi:hypothetical protein
MAIAVLTFQELLAPLQGLFNWLLSRPRGRTCQAPARPRQSLHCPAAARPRPRPLRVVRVVETSPGTPGAGRMVISGRMADVCAELDRLAALEAAGR